MIINSCDELAGWQPYENVYGTVTIDPDNKVEGLGSLRYEGDQTLWGGRVEYIPASPLNLDIEHMLKFSIRVNEIYGNVAAVRVISPTGWKQWNLTNLVTTPDTWYDVTVDLKSTGDSVSGTLELTNITKIWFIFEYIRAVGKYMWVDNVIAEPLVIHVLTVQSSPVTGIPITVNGVEGYTPATFQVGDGSTPTITAPSEADAYYFNHWERNGTVIGTENPVTISPVTADTTIIAVYTEAPPPPPPPPPIHLLIGALAVAGVLYLLLR